MNWENIFYYDETSPTCLKWKHTRRNPKFNNVTVLKDTNAGCLRFFKDGKPKNSAVNISSRSYYIQRIIFEMQNCCTIPEGYVIDHIDGNPHNNRISNLRMVTYQGNAHNVRKTTRNTSGITGVSYCSIRKRWRAIWRDIENKQTSRSFAVDKYGETLAKQMAINARNEAILQVIEDGGAYTERHGK